MTENRLAVIATALSDYNVRFSEDETLLEIINPCGNENIRLEYDSGDKETPYMLSFAFQHWHMNDEEDIVEHINDIINGKLFSIEFFENGKRRFGGDIGIQELEKISYEVLERYTGFYGNQKIKDLADSFKVRGWKAETNFDAKFVVDESGNVTIEKI